MSKCSTTPLLGFPPLPPHSTCHTLLTLHPAPCILHRTMRVVSGGICMAYRPSLSGGRCMAYRPYPFCPAPSLLLTCNSPRPALPSPSRIYSHAHGWTSRNIAFSEARQLVQALGLGSEVQAGAPTEGAGRDHGGSECIAGMDPE